MLIGSQTCLEGSFHREDEQTRLNQRIVPRELFAGSFSREGYSLQFAATSVKPLLSINYGEYR